MNSGKGSKFFFWSAPNQIYNEEFFDKELKVFLIHFSHQEINF